MRYYRNGETRVLLQSGTSYGLGKTTLEAPLQTTLVPQPRLRALAVGTALPTPLPDLRRPVP